MRQARFTATIHQDDFKRLRQGRKTGGVLGACLVLAMVSIFGGVSLSPTALEFSGVPVGAGSVLQKLTLTNRDRDDFHPRNILIQGAAAADFRVDRSSCDTVKSGESCTLLVEFQPQEPGERRAHLVMETSDGKQLNTELSGVATASPTTVSPGSMDFESIPPGTQSPAQEVVLTGAGGFHVHGTSVSGDADQFGRSIGRCQREASYLTTCRLTVWFAPQSAGTWRAQLMIQDDGVGGPHTVLLSGVSTNVPVPLPPPDQAHPQERPLIRVEPTALDFTSRERQQNVTVFNDGDAPLQISASLQGANPDRFEADTHSCTTALAPGHNCRIEVKYKPKVWASRSNYSAQLDLSHNAPNMTTPQNIALRWERVVTPDLQPHITVVPASLDFSDFYNAVAMERIGNVRPQRNISLVNDGPVALKQMNLRVGFLDGGRNGPFSHTDNCKQLAVGQQCTETVYFAPTQRTSYREKLYIFEGILNQLATVDLTATSPAPPAPPVGLTASPDGSSLASAKYKNTRATENAPSNPAGDRWNSLGRCLP